MLCGAPVSICGADVKEKHTSKHLLYNDHSDEIIRETSLSLFFLFRQLRIYAQALQIETANYAANVTKVIFDYFEEYFDMEYSIEKLGKSVKSYWIDLQIHYHK